MIETTKQTTVIFTDYTANISIAKQTILTNKNIDEFNFPLVKTSIYFFQFRFNVKYRPGKKRVIPDAFSRLLFGNGPATLPRNNPNDFLNLDIYFRGILKFSENLNCY